MITYIDKQKDFPNSIKEEDLLTIKTLGQSQQSQIYRVDKALDWEARGRGPNPRLSWLTNHSCNSSEHVSIRPTNCYSFILFHLHRKRHPLNQRTVKYIMYNKGILYVLCQSLQLQPCRVVGGHQQEGRKLLHIL